MRKHHTKNKRKTVHTCEKEFLILTKQEMIIRNIHSTCTGMDCENPVKTSLLQKTHFQARVKHVKDNPEKDYADWRPSFETKLEPQYLQRTHTGTGRMCNPHAQTQSFTHSSNKLLLYISGEDSLRLDEASDLFPKVNFRGRGH